MSHTEHNKHGPVANLPDVPQGSANPLELVESYGRVQLCFVATVVVLLAIAVIVPFTGLTGNALWLSFFFFTKQDVPFLAFLLLPLLVGARIGKGRGAKWLEML